MSAAAGLRLSPTAHLAASGDCNWPPQLAALGEFSLAADNRFLGQLHHCLQTGQIYDPIKAFDAQLDTPTRTAA